MRTSSLSPAALEKLAARLPSTYDVKNVRVIRASATVVPITRPEPLEAALLASLETAGGVPMITDGKPTVMRVVAWVAHEGVNRNRLAFVAEDLVEAAGKIGPPDGFLPMDFNHSAVNSWTMEQAVIGMWTSAEVLDNPQVAAPRGPKGLLARGLVWSWAFPDYSTRLLAEQARHGHIEFSMACIPEWTEQKKDADGEYEVARKPVFFTFSALDVDPADPDAQGLGEEGSDDPNLEADLKTKLLTQTAEQILQTLQRFQVAAQPKEDKQMDETVKQILALLSANAESIATKEDLEKMLQKIAEVGGLVERIKVEPGAIAAKDAEIDRLTGKVQELETALSAANTQVTEAGTQIQTLETKVAEQESKLAEYATRDAEEATAARLAKRLGELPEHIRSAHDAQDAEKRTAIETRWASKTDEEWQEVLDTFALVPRTASYRSRSEQAGGKLPLGGKGAAVDFQKYLN